MTFDDLYPDAPDSFQPEDSHNEVFKCANGGGECFTCRQFTRWIELNFEAPMCSPECNDKAWREYFTACAIPSAIVYHALAGP